MTIEQCYNAIESNYEEVLGRFAGNKMLVEKFARKFLDDPSYQLLKDALGKQDYEEAHLKRCMCKSWFHTAFQSFKRYHRGAAKRKSGCVQASGAAWKGSC